MKINHPHQPRHDGWPATANSLVLNAQYHCHGSNRRLGRRSTRTARRHLHQANQGIRNDLEHQWGSTGIASTETTVPSVASGNVNGSLFGSSSPASSMVLSPGCTALRNITRPTSRTVVWSHIFSSSSSSLSFTFPPASARVLCLAPARSCLLARNERIEWVQSPAVSGIIGCVGMNDCRFDTARRSESISPTDSHDRILEAANLESYS